MFVLAIAPLALAAEPAPSPVDARAHERLDEALDRVEATPDQRHAAERRVDQALDELRALRERASDLREQIHDALFGAVVDRAALEVARQELLSVVDDGSMLLFDAAADLAELFTAAQREELHTARHERLRDRMAAWWRGAAE